VRSMLNVHGLGSWMSIRSCFNMAMGGTGILETRFWLRFNTRTLLKRSLPILVLLFSWQTFWDTRRLSWICQGSLTGLFCWYLKSIGELLSFPNSFVSWFASFLVILPFVKMSECCIFRLRLLELKVLLLAMLVVLLLLSWRHIPIFWHENMR